MTKAHTQGDVEGNFSTIPYLLIVVGLHVCKSSKRP